MLLLQPLMIMASNFHETYIYYLKVHKIILVSIAYELNPLEVILHCLNILHCVTTVSTMRSLGVSMT